MVRKGHQGRSQINIMTSIAVFVVGLTVFQAPGLDKSHLTKNFLLKDFQRGCPDKIPDELIDNLCNLAINLQVIRNHIKKPIRIISGYRSLRCNKRVRGAKNSQHMKAKAADIRVRGMSTRKLKAIIEKLIKTRQISQGGLGLYKWHVHYDVREKRARWYKIDYKNSVCLRKK